MSESRAKAANRYGPSVTAPLRKGESTMKMNATMAVPSVVESRAGRNWRKPGARLDGSCHADRNGLVTTSRAPQNRTRCDGLSRASRSTSMPKIWCQVRSKTPPAAKTNTPASPRP